MNEKKELDVFIDTETTGLGHADKREKREDGIIQIGIAYRDENGEIITYSKLCRPDNRYFEGNRADEALNVSKIPLLAIQHAPRDYIVANMVRNYLNSLGNIVLHSYNVPFDKVFLEHEPWHFSYKWGYDPMKMMAKILKTDDWISLVKARDHFKIELDGNPHNAKYDARLTLLVYEECQKILGSDYHE